jgi:lipopolysaccharide export system protein LptA
MTFPLLSLVMAVSLVVAAPAAWAEKADRDKPMNVESDALRYDDLRQTSVFTGQVVATKGTIVIRGARLEVRQDPEGFQFGVVTSEPGRRAFWRQKREGVEEYIEGEAETIEYDGRADRVKFIGRAELRRFRGTVLADETQGSLITYENTTDMFTVNGQVAGDRRASASATNPGGRVRTVLSPRTATSAPAAPASAPASGPGAPAALRPTPRLGGGDRP